jgi:catechol 2,3-dioxygenase-like lactoylglutathione lyase family enzyme
MTTGTRNDPQCAARCRLHVPRIASWAAGIVFALVCITCSVAPFARESAALAVQRVAMIGFTVSDMDRSVSFYSDVLSFEKVAEFQVTGDPYDHLQGVFGSRARIVHMRLGDQIVELTQYVAPPDGRPIPVPSRSNDLWFEHMAIVVSDMDQAYQSLQRHQVRQISPEPQTIPASTFRRPASRPSSSAIPTIMTWSCCGSRRTRGRPVGIRPATGSSSASTTPRSPSATPR